MRVNFLRRYLQVQDNDRRSHKVFQEINIINKIKKKRYISIIDS